MKCIITRPIFLKATSADTKEFPKAAGTGNFMKNSSKNCQPKHLSDHFEKSSDGFRNLFLTSLSAF